MHWDGKTEEEERKKGEEKGFPLGTGAGYDFTLPPAECWLQEQNNAFLICVCRVSSCGHIWTEEYSWC